jgi:hypothetical protein
LSTTISPIEGGKIIVSPQTPNYKEGEVVTLTPEPNEHWVFKQWEGDGTGSSTPLQLTMNSNKSVVGVFVKRDYPLTITIEGEGTVEEKIVPNLGGREYPHGTTVELTPKPKEGWVFDSWGGDLTGSETPKTIKVDKEKNVTVKFKRKDYPLNITITGEGTVIEKIITTPGGRSYPFETVLELTPKPKEGWVFESWGGDLTGTETSKTIKIDKLKNVTVKFKSAFYLKGNGITCMCPDTKPGDKGFINGIQYESVDNNLLIKRRDEGADMSRLCTSLVTDMSDLFEGQSGSNPNTFNQPIGNWDVSNVYDMTLMFNDSQFNQPIGDWDVSNVKSMRRMFSGTLYWPTSFNQPIGNWDVSKVIDMEGMFNGSQFNQSIGNWDVSEVENMRYMFGYSPFNQPIGNWNVSKVTRMNAMFANSPFNQPIGNWNVSKVNDMVGMFLSSSFNQNISKWCVIKINSEPQNFSSNSPLISQNKPKWGTCPN